MKKLLSCLCAVGVISLIVVIISLGNPNNDILAISQSSGKEYDEIVVIHSNRTYEQLLQKKSDGSVIRYGAEWLPSKEDPVSQSLSAHTGTNISNNYITFKDKLSVDNETKQLKSSGSSIEPTMGLSDPDEKLLAVVNQWRSKAKPFDIEAKSPSN